MASKSKSHFAEANEDGLAVGTGRLVLRLA